jgi:ATP-dependent exoDNAse (exonuclease V) alpha subunit
MAIYHLSVKTVSRSEGRTATGAAAYRAGCRIVDERTGEIHDYTRKRGVESTHLVLPEAAPAWASDRSAVWNAAERSELRINSTVAREFEVALPSELDAAGRQAVAHQFAQEIVARHGCIADVAIHRPSRAGDTRNHHAHILCSTRRLTPTGFAEKTRELDERKRGEVGRWRERYAELQNDVMQAAGVAVQVDHRSLDAQGIDRMPTVHLGPKATNYERRTGEVSRRRQELEQEVRERLQRARMQGELERQAAAAEKPGVLDTTGNLTAAQQARARDAVRTQADAGVARFRDQFAQEKDARQKAQRLAQQQALDLGRSLGLPGRDGPER